MPSPWWWREFVANFKSKSMSAQRVERVEFEEAFDSICIDLVSAKVGGQVLSCSDEWFAKASNLIAAKPPISKPGEFTFEGAWYDG